MDATLEKEDSKPWSRGAVPEDLIQGAGACLRCRRRVKSIEELYAKHTACVEWIRGMRWELRKKASLVRPEDIIREVANYFHVSEAAILDGEGVPGFRRKGISRVRHIAIWLCHERLPELSSPEIGQVFRRDHTTILAAYSRIGAEMDGEAGGRLREDIAAIESML